MALSVMINYTNIFWVLKSNIVLMANLSFLETVAQAYTSTPTFQNCFYSESESITDTVCFCLSWHVQLPSACPYPSSHCTVTASLPTLGIYIKLALYRGWHMYMLVLIRYISETFHRRNLVLQSIISYWTTEYDCFCKISIECVVCLYGISHQFDQDNPYILLVVWYQRCP